MNTAMLLKPKSLVSYIYGDLTAEEGLKQFTDIGYSAIPVIDRDGMYIGVVSDGVFLDRLLDSRSENGTGMDGLTVAELATRTRFEPVTIDAPLETLLSRIVEQNFIPVIDSRGTFSGIITRRDVLLRAFKKLYDVDGAGSSAVRN